MESQENVRAKSYAAIPCFCSPYGPGGDTEGNPRRRPAARENLVAIARRKRRRSDVDSEFSVHVGVVVNQPAKYHEMNVELKRKHAEKCDAYQPSGNRTSELPNGALWPAQQHVVSKI